MNSFLKQLQIKASTFEEVFLDEFTLLPGQKEDSDRAALRLAAWCRSSASGDWVLFSKRLKKEGLSEGQVLARFSTLGASFQNTPEWVNDSEWIVECLESPSKSLPSSKSENEVSDKVPFEDLFITYLENASQIATAKLPFNYEQYFTSSGWFSVKSILLKQISRLTEASLFNLFIKHLKTESIANPRKIISTTSDSEYKIFIENLKKGGIRQLFIEKPVLLRLIAIVTRQWINATTALIQHTHTDFLEVTNTFIPGSDVYIITKVIGGLSDAHNLGKSVLILEINGDKKIVYKPKNLNVDLQWFTLCEKLNALEPPINLHAVKTIGRDEYGWTEFISHDPCTSKDEFALFFKRAGSWLALFHMYASTDMHFENIIASGSDPIPIDLEMILQGSSPENELKAEELLAFNEASEKVSSSVLSVGMLPAYSRLPNDEIIDMSGLNAVTQSFTVGVWSNINTNGMRWSKEEKTLKEHSNIPHHNGNYAKLRDYLAEFIAGFKAYSQFLLETRRQNGIKFFLGDFENLQVRKLIRPTRFYAMLMERLKDHRKMEDGITWSVQADFLARLANWDSLDDVIWPLQKSERDALLCLNIPYFTTTTDGQDISDLNGRLMISSAISGLDRARNRFESLSEDEIAWQAKVIELSTLTISRSDKNELSIKYKCTRDLPRPQELAHKHNEFEACAEGMADLILKSAFQKGSGTAWLSLDWMGESEVARLMPMGPDLYGGTTGVAIFLAAYHQHCGSKSSHDMSYKVIAGIRYALKKNTSARWARNLGIGGACGLGSIVYGLSTISQLLKDPELLNDAEAAVLLFTSDLIRADEGLDIIVGSAGAILGLLKFHNISGLPLALEKAILCGEHLLKVPRYGEVGARSWANKHFDKPLSGMSHGASGFALAMFALFEKTQRTDFLEAGKECLEYEKLCFDAEHKNWADLRGEPQFICQWCHGAVGIGLARLGISKEWGGYRQELEGDIRISLDTVKDQWPNKFDTLCCGTLGAIELFREAGKAFDDVNLQDMASQRFMSILAASKDNQGFSSPTIDFKYNLGLFQGAAGVGYTALRQINDRLPNILLWQ
jgi:type 2 lantibiotic biosynthesis protein LanM